MRVPSDQAGTRLIRIADYDLSWPARFVEIGVALRRALGDVAVRVDHIGSTSVPGLAAKPIVDVQVPVERLEPVAPFRDPLVGMGLVYRAENPERTKRYFREAPGQPRTHIHVRRAGSFSEQFALLFRDFLRVDHWAASDYVKLKRTLAQRVRWHRLVSPGFGRGAGRGALCGGNLSCTFQLEST